MKKFLLIFSIALILILCGCKAGDTASKTHTDATENNNTQIEIADIKYGTFSYKEDTAKYKIGDKGVINWGLKNTKEQTVKDGYTAVSIAHNEIIVLYDNISADYDKDAKVWRVNFYLKGSETKDNQVVYIDEKGKTIMYLWGI